MENVFDLFKERGLIAQVTDEEKVRSILGSEKVTFYTGFDPTADSLHVGHFMQLIIMRHMQRAGHRPIVLLGGGTTMVGDPTGKTDMRKMLSKEQIAANAERFKKQMSKFIDVSDGKAIFLNNADWLLNLNYIDFLREIGVHFSVNKMLTAECFKTRLERGLSFIEFNYMLMQSYDFLKLARDYNCRMEFGGNDQWSNIIGGVELNRRCDQREVYGMTFTLLTTREGKKMGKTEKGALWLDPEKTSPYEFYQYWRNIDDADVENCMKLLTFMPLDEIAAMCEHKDERINAAKARLAFELTAIVHGVEEAEKAEAQSLAAFASSGGELPTATVPEGVNNIVDIMCAVKAAKSKSEARQLISGGGVKVGEEKITSFDTCFTEEQLKEGIILHKGKKMHVKVVRG